MIIIFNDFRSYNTITQALSELFHPFNKLVISAFNKRYSELNFVQIKFSCSNFTFRMTNRMAHLFSRRRRISRLRPLCPHVLPTACIECTPLAHQLPQTLHKHLVRQRVASSSCTHSTNTSICTRRTRARRSASIARTHALCTRALIAIATGTLKTRCRCTSSRLL